ncbi:C12orf56-like [Scleropages formosus]|uniref:C12orf56-like n=1 Tax=Scleropages formosus TaxID=113540 RepID=A0A0P7YI45_SCLFO|nr:C12orf56-like [Scleropages formosus]
MDSINDLPDFLSGRDRERSQHIRVVHISAKHLGEKDAWHRGEKAKPCPPESPSQQKNLTTSPSRDGLGSILLSTHSAPPGFNSWKPTSPSRSWPVRSYVFGSLHRHRFVSPCQVSISSQTWLASESFLWLLGGRGEEEEELKVKQRRSASCHSTYLKELRVLPSQPLPLAHPSSPRLSSCIPLSAPSGSGGTGRKLKPDRRGSILARLMKKSPLEGNSVKEEAKRTELHLYAVSPTSRIYLHLLSSWKSYIIVRSRIIFSTRRSRLPGGCQSLISVLVILWSQRSTLLLDPRFRKRCSISSSSGPQDRHRTSWERTAYLFGQLSRELLQENITLEALYLLLQELHAAAHRNTAIRRLFWRTLGLMFRETEVESARFALLTAKRGALTERLLLALVCDPELDLRDAANGPKFGFKLQALLVEYLDAASALLFEAVVMSQQATYTPGLEHFVTVGWALKTLQTHRFALPFISYMAREVLFTLSQSILSPAQAVLLYQRCQILLACLQYSADLSWHIKTTFREEFRYYVKVSWVEDKIPPHYPISQPTIRLLSRLLHLVLQRS